MKIFRKYIILLGVIGILFLTSCQFALKTFYGIKKPKTETEKSLKKYLKRKDINSDNIYAVNYKDFTEIVKQIGGIPEILVFEKNGKLIKYKEETDCNASAFDFVEELSTAMEFQYIDSIKLDNYLLKLKDFKGKSVEFEKQPETDFYLFIFWTRYTGRLNKDHVKIWEEQANNNKNSKIKVIKVNLDQQEWWEEIIKNE